MPRRTALRHQFGGAVQIQLFHDSPAMGFHRVQAEVQTIGNFLVAVAFGEQLVDLPLAIGQAFEPVGDVRRSFKRAKPS